MDSQANPGGVDLIIDEELQNYLPAVAQTTDAELERQLLITNGPAHPLTVWKGKRILLDGHRRHRLCKKLGLDILPKDIIELEFDNRDDVKRWMISWQLCRRNLTGPQTAMYLSQMMAYEQAKKTHNPTQRVAQQAGVSERTVQRASRYAQAVNSLPVDIRERVVSGEIKASEALIVELAAFGELHLRSIIATVDNGTYSSLKSALHGTDGDSDIGTVSESGNELPPEPTEPPAVSGDSIPTPPVNKPDTVSPNTTTTAPATAAKFAAGQQSPADLPPTKKPQASDAASVVKTAQKALAVVSACLDRLNGLRRDRSKCEACRALLKDLSNEIESMK